MKIQDLAEKWKKFEEYQNRIYKRNLNSDEYHEFQKQDTRTWASTSWFYQLELIAKRDMYPQTLEGMLKWINDGEKD